MVGRDEDDWSRDERVSSLGISGKLIREWLARNWSVDRVLQQANAPTPQEDRDMKYEVGAEILSAKREMGRSVTIDFTTKLGLKYSGTRAVGGRKLHVYKVTSVQDLRSKKRS